MMKVEGKIHAQWDSFNKDWRYTMFTQDMSDYGYIFIETVSIDFEPPPHAEMIKGTVAAYRAKQREVRAKAEADAAAIQTMIDDMMCLEFKPEPQA